MSTSSLLLDIYKALTGLASPPGRSAEHWKPCKGIEDLNGYNVIYSSDRVLEAVPDRAMPYIVMEVGGIATLERKYAKAVTLYFDIAVKGQASNTLDESSRVSNAFSAWLVGLKVPSAIMFAVDSIDYSVVERQTQYMNTRFATIMARAVVEEKW